MRVSLLRCRPDSTDSEVIDKTEEAIYALEDFGHGLRSARLIAVKINAGVASFVLTEGRQTELTDPAVVEGVVRAIRSVTDAEIVIGDAPTHRDHDRIYSELRLAERLSAYPRVRLLDFAVGDMVPVKMRHDAPMFSEYILRRELAEADAFVSVAKMKAHSGMGFTLCMKNLFGWLPPDVYGGPRTYLHDRLIRLPRVIADLATHMKPCLNVVDATVATSRSEWHGTPLTPGLILAGTNIVATDTVGARVMGFDPTRDYPNHPFFYRRNPILLAAARGLGPAPGTPIEFHGPEPEEVAVAFDVHRYSGNTERDAQIRRGAACVAAYVADQSKLAERFAGSYLAMTGGQVLWDAPTYEDHRHIERARVHDWRDAPEFVIHCLCPEQEVEQFDRYREEAEMLDAPPL